MDCHKLFVTYMMTDIFIIWPVCFTLSCQTASNVWWVGYASRRCILLKHLISPSYWGFTCLHALDFFYRFCLTQCYVVIGFQCLLLWMTSEENVMHDWPHIICIMLYDKSVNVLKLLLASFLMRSMTSTHYIFGAIKCLPVAWRSQRTFDMAYGKNRRTFCSV